ncbi:gliding motility-associated C-terminal domain-containing protein [Galbibacter sp. PAP.153]|uniref:T9SS type B sorting domain-containing protein n=1 Tax=Galbibacter sp. PAP.153 TaxID=3104623 RepID=UPI00300AFE88
MKKITTYAVFCLLLAYNSYGQKISAPQLQFEYACVNDGFNDFEATFAFNEKPFNADNVFFIELSDKNGSFNNAKVLKTVEGQNYSFEFTESFSLPETVYGENYKMRLRASSPAMIGEATAAFDAFFVPNEELVLNNFQDVSLCSTSGATINLDKDVADEYVWYKNGEILKVTTENKLNVTEPGEYYAEPYYGNCTGTLYSNLVIVTKGENFEVSILGGENIQTCANSPVTLEASVDNENYIYAWYKNNEKIGNLPEYAPTLEINKDGEGFGVYRLEVTNDGGCTSSSSEVSLLQNKNTIVEIISPLNAVIIGNNKATLSIGTNNNIASINWYKDGQLMKDGINSSSLTVSQQGEYYAEVSSGNDCDDDVKSETFKVYEPLSFTAQIGTDASYKACQTTKASLKLTSLRGTLSNGDEITIDNDFLHNFNMVWLKDDETTQQTGASIALDYKKNGKYQLQITYKGETFMSNSKEMVLGLPDIALTIDKPMSCISNQGRLLATPLEGATYKWFKNGTLVASGLQNSFSTENEGTYYAEVSYGGCAISTEKVDLKKNTEDLITIYPGEQITISPDRIIQANATGGESYEWLDSEGNILSTNTTFNIQEEGTYTLIAQVGSCKIEKNIEVTSNNVVQISNVVSPNNDSINDKWTLPQKFINDPDTEVIICDSYGSTILKTNNYTNNWPDSSTNMSTETPVFYYFINKKGKNIKKGSITLVN